MRHKKRGFKPDHVPLWEDWFSIEDSETVKLDEIKMILDATTTDDQEHQNDAAIALHLVLKISSLSLMSQQSHHVSRVAKMFLTV